MASGRDFYLRLVVSSTRQNLRDGGIGRMEPAQREKSKVISPRLKHIAHFVLLQAARGGEIPVGFQSALSSRR